MTFHKDNRGQSVPKRISAIAESTVLRVTAGVSVAALASVLGAQAANAQVAVCPEPGQGAAASRSGGTTAAERLRDRDPLVREMARADVLYDEGRREEAAVIYRKLAGSAPDRRQTARRANLRLAQVAMAEKNFAAAEDFVQRATTRGAPADIRARARELQAQIAYRRQVAEADGALDQVDALVAARQFDAAIATTQALLQRQCPYPPDYPARVKTRLARIYRAQGDFQAARAMALDAQASAATPTIQQGAAQLIGEIDVAAMAAELRGSISRANDLLAAGDTAGAIGILEPIVARPGLPPEIETTGRLRLARAYAQAGRFDAATTLLDPLLARGVSSGEGALDPDDYESIARVYLARANSLQESGRYAEAGAAYQQMLAWNPPVGPEVRDSARLGLARALARTGNRAGALEQVELVRASPATPQLAERAGNLLADIQNAVPMNRLVGYVEAGIAYDSNVPTRISAVLEDNDDDLAFPANQRFDDWHARLEGRLEYRHQLGQSANYIDFRASGLRTFQFELSDLNRTRFELRAGPVFSFAGGATEVLMGGKFDIEWRGDSFRSSEPGAYLGVRHDLSDRLTMTGLYGVGWHNNFRDDRDGVHYSFDGELRAEPSEADVVRARFRATREGAKIERFRSWRLLGGVTWNHTWGGHGRVAPFLELGADAERVIYDGLSSGIERRDWRVRANAEAGAEIDRSWRASVNYGFYDISSNEPDRSRLANHQIGVNLRYSWR